MPIDPIKVAATVTLTFLAVSLYFTARDLGRVFSIPFWSLGVIGIIFIPSSALFLYARGFSGGTALGYWSYLKTEIAAHLVLTLYVLSTAIIIWSSLQSTEKLLYILSFFMAFLFYVTAALDIRKLTKDLKIRVRTPAPTLARYLISIFSSFFIIYFIVLLTKGKTTNLDQLLGSYPYFPLSLMGIFFIFYFAFLRQTRKGFEELMKSGTITTLSYVMPFGVFVTIFLLYFKMTPGGVLSKFPLFGTVFFGYFAILVADVYSATTLRVREIKEKKDIIDLLNHIAGHFFRTDILEEMWDDVVETYKNLDPMLERARFYAPDRTFDLGMVNERARVAASVAMILKMDKAAKEEGATVVPFEEDVAEGMKTLLGEKLLLIPDDLSRDFKTDQYYPKLLESTFTRINDAIKPFVSFEDYTGILKKLIGVDVFFNNLSFDEKGVRIKEGLELSKKEFLMYLKLYIQGLENIFPFNRMLLRETVRSEIENRLSLFGFTQADILNIVPTGVKELDDVFYGGFIKGTQTLFLTEERRAKNDVLFMFTAEGLKEREPGIFGTSRIASKELLEAFKRVLGPTDNLSIIDLHLSTHTDNVVQIPVSKEGRQIISTSLIQVKQAVVTDIKKHSKEAHKRVVLDIYSDLARYQNLQEIYDLIIKQVDGFKRWNCTSIVTLAPNLSTDELERHFDNVLSLTDVATIRIKKLFGGKPKRENFIIWGTYSPIEEPDLSLFFEGQK